jgi:hypothetical protein
VRKKRFDDKRHDSGLHSHVLIFDPNEPSSFVSFHSNSLPSIVKLILSYGAEQRQSYVPKVKPPPDRWTH